MVLRPFCIALRFLSRFPCPDPEPVTAEERGRSLAWYPWVGLLIGTFLWFIALATTVLPDVVSAALILLVWTWLSGGLHLDGLADTTDAWVGGLGNPERTLEIMKDPRSGAMGVTALIIDLLLRFAGILALLQLHVPQALLVLPMLGRGMMILLIMTTPYVRKQGLATDLVQHYRGRTCRNSLLLSAAFCFVIWGAAAAIMIAAAIALGELFRFNMLQRINGFTGDTAGALCEMTETLILIAYIVWLSVLPLFF